MNFRQFYEEIEAHIASSGGLPKPVPFEFMRQLVTRDNDLVETLTVWRVTYTPPIREARFTLFDDRESRYDDPVYIAEISFCASLEDSPAFLYYALTKELMHVFDPMDTWINTRDKFISFLRDLQNRPLEMENGAISVEHKARWMALVAICPQSVRDYIRNSYATGSMKEELAQELGLPSAVIDIALDEYYEKARALLLA